MIMFYMNGYVKVFSGPYFGTPKDYSMPLLAQNDRSRKIFAGSSKI